MCGNPGSGLALVRLCAPKMDNDDCDEEWKNEGFVLEVGRRRALPYAIPFCIGDRWKAGLRR